VQARGRGPRLTAHAVRFDPRNDVAVLRVDGLEEPALSLAPVVRTGTPGAVLGFPNDGPYDVEAARVGGTQTAISQDAYGRGPVTRVITSFRGLVREGNSGGPLVDSSGRVLTTVFAATVGDAAPGGYGVPDSVVRDALANARGRVGTGPCAS
jgi:S1-C subfamily serine protease